MGLSIYEIKALLASRRSGVDFTSVLTLGRQTVFASPEEIFQLFEAFGLNTSLEEIEQMITAHDHYAEGLLHYLGAKEVHSTDHSEYEGATIIHDMNQPVPASLKNRYSLVMDCGTLEHVFNFPQAIRNSMEMVRPEGHFVAITPSNNFPGHGFYQFSPELFFRIFTPDNGFKMDHVIVFDIKRESRWYQVVDPEILKRRVIYDPLPPTYLYIQAKKTSIVEIFAKTPQQSDYVVAWAHAEQSDTTVSEQENSQQTSISLAQKIYRRLPNFLQRIYRIIKSGRYVIQQGGGPEDVLRTIDPEALKEWDMTHLPDNKKL
ncbi:MAG: hypothetical protein HQL72_05495 [Magnetococcales bacterium]|nr:hypothetical protein [Magnetococcales bacterium]